MLAKGVACGPRAQEGGQLLGKGHGSKLWILGLDVEAALDQVLNINEAAYFVLGVNNRQVVNAVFGAMVQRGAE